MGGNGVGADREPRDNKDRLAGGMAGLTGDPITMAIAGKLRRDRMKDPDAKYDGSVATGGPFEATPYEGPQLQAYEGGPTSSMDLTSAGPAETFYNRNIGQLADPGMAESSARNRASRLQQPSSTDIFRTRNRDALEGPGAAESFFGRHQGRFNQPTASQQFSQQLPGQAPQASQQFNQSLSSMGPTNAQQAFEGLGSMPNFDAYYDRARERQAGGMNDQLAARGQFGSSAGMDQISQGMSDLNAQQANREADFAMQQAQQRLGAASAADASNQSILNTRLGAAQGADSAAQSFLNTQLGASQAADTTGQSLLGLGLQGANQAQSQELARLGLGGSLAGQSDSDHIARAGLIDQIYSGADAGRINRLSAGMQGATAAGGERFGRIGQAFNTQRTAQQDFLNTLGPSLMNMLNADRSSLDTALAGEAGLVDVLANNARANLAYETQNLQNNINTGFQAINTGGEIAGSIYGAV